MLRVESVTVESFNTIVLNRLSVESCTLYVEALADLFHTKFKVVRLPIELFAGEISEGAAGTGCCGENETPRNTVFVAAVVITVNEDELPASVTVASCV